MQLPDDAIGVSDLLGHRECARRFAWQMRRHTEAGEPPEADNWTNAYGHAAHEAFTHLGEGLSDDEAIQKVFNGRLGRWLSPDDLARLKDDIATYRSRDFVGVEMILSERDLRVPLFHHNGRIIYFRFKVDRLYRQLNTNVFIQVDYKTSRHPKSEDDVHSDIQMSAYNWGLHEIFPEMEDLVQVYDQLNFGVIPTRRTPEQRELIREWLIRAATAVLEDDALEPSFNQWCAYCPIIADCPIISQLSDYSLSVISALAPEEKLGRKTVLNLDREKMETYVAELEKVDRAKTVLGRYSDAVRDVLKEMPIDRRLELGFKTTVPNLDTWTTLGLRAVRDHLGDERFLELVNLPKTAVSRLSKEDRDIVNGYTTRLRGAPRLTRVKEKEE